MARMEIEIDGKLIPFKASGATPMMYRSIAGGDMFKHMAKLSDRFEKNKSEGVEFESEDLIMFENVAYCMAKQADPSIPEKEKWYDEFETFSIYMVLDKLLGLLNTNQRRTVEAKKKFASLQEK